MRADGTVNSMYIPYDCNTMYPLLSANGINGERVWWNCTAAEHCPIFGIAGQGGYCFFGGLNLTSTPVRPGRQFSANGTQLSAVLSAGEDISFQVNTKLNTTYQFSYWVNTVGVTGGNGVYVSVFPTDGAEGGGGNYTVSSLNTSVGWTQVSGEFNTGNNNPGQAYLLFVNIKMDAGESGTAYITDLSLKEDLGATYSPGNGSPGQGTITGGGITLGPELLWRTHFEPWNEVPQTSAWQADQQVEIARANTYYLKIIAMEKLDSAFCTLQPNGTINFTPQAYSPDNFYGNSTSSWSHLHAVLLALFNSQMGLRY